MKPGMKTKILTALLLIAIIFYPVVFGGPTLRILLGVITLMAAYEISALKNQKGDWILTIIFTVVVVVFTFVPANLYAVALGFFIIFLFLVVFVLPNFSIDHAAFSLLIVVIISLAWQAVMRIYSNGMNFRGAILILLATFLTDTGAYFFGMFFGKHKMAPTISPNKTWEGAIGGYLVGALGSFLFGFLMLKEYPMSFLAFASCVLPFVAEIGDLAFSSIKRRFGIKDFGSFLPGHGGILDRIDSLLFTLMIMNALLMIWGL